MSLSKRSRLSAQGVMAGLFAGLLLLGCGHDKAKSSDVDAGGPKAHAVWSMMGCDSTNTYTQPDETILTVDNAKNLVEQWRFTVAGMPTGSPSIADGKVFAMSSAGTYALDLASGKQLWANMDVGGTASLAYADGFLYAHSATGANLYKLSAADGSVVWGPVPTYPEQARCDGTSSPIVADGKVLVGHSCGVVEVSMGDDQATVRGGVEAFDTSDGSHLWTYFTVPERGENGAMVWSTVSVDLDAKVVFASTGNNYTMGGEDSDSIHAIDLETGVRKWKTQVRQNDVWSFGNSIAPLGEDTDFGANPILAVADGKKIVAAGDKGSAFWALDRENGEILWSYDKLSSTHTQNNGGVLMNGAFDGKYFYVASNQPPGEAVLHVLDPKDGTDALPTQMLGATVWGAPSLANGLLFLPVNNVLRVYNAKTGMMLNSFDTGGTIAAGAAAIADGMVVVKSGLQYVFAQDAMSNNQIIAYGLGKPGDTHPADAGSSTHPADAGNMAAAGQPTFSGVYTDIIQGAGCAGSTLCHGGNVGGLQMSNKQDAYTALVGVNAMGTNLTPDSGADCKDSGLVRVVASKPDDSLLIQKLEGTQPCGMSMPPGAMLTSDQIQQVRTWIQNGANND